MKISKFQKIIPKQIFTILKRRGFINFRPAQHKSINKGLFDNKNLLVCTPTASGKTLVGELAALDAILDKKGKVIYVVPLKALASEKYGEFKKRYPELKVVVTSGDVDSEDRYLENYDFIITTSEKLDSLLRHKASWVLKTKTLIIDEIHLLNDPSRGPTLEMIIILMRKLIKKLQIIGLSATIGNPEELAEWLKAELVIDNWRPVKLKQGVYLNEKIEFIK